jgi:hypothetical protein
MTRATDDLIERGLRAWTAGDLEALEAVLDPAVTLRWVEPGDWDCIGRDQVIRLLRQRQAEGNAVYPVSIEHVDEHTFIVSSSRRRNPSTSTDRSRSRSRLALRSTAARSLRCSNTVPTTRAQLPVELRQASPQPAQRFADDRPLMPVPLHHHPARGAELIAHPRSGGGVQRVLAAAGLLVQEVRASQTDTDFGVTAEPDEIGLRIGRAAAASFERFGSV